MVLDQEHILTSIEINKLDSLYKDHEKKTSNEIALITTVKYVPDTSILSYATELGNKYGVGKDGRNNGVVILVSTAKQQVAIATGKGTEKVLKDEIAQKIIDSFMITKFRQGKNFEAIWDGSIEVIKFLELPRNKIK